MDKTPFSDFIDTACAQVRFRPDRVRIAEELSAHLEDRADMLMTHGFDQKTAQLRSVAAMGDPVEIGKELDREHSPLWGWAHIWTDILRYIALLLTGLLLFLLISGAGLGKVFYESGQTLGGFEEETVLLTIPLWEWHATEHFWVCFTKAEVFQYTGSNHDLSDLTFIRLFYHQWHRNPFLHTEQYITLQALRDDTGALIFPHLDLDHLRPEAFYYEFTSPDGAAFTVEVPLDWEEIK